MFEVSGSRLRSMMRPADESAHVNAFLGQPAYVKLRETALTGNAAFLPRSTRTPNGARSWSPMWCRAPASGRSSESWNSCVVEEPEPRGGEHRS
ncbi:hypothetical protein EN848_33545, partial [bacterium M00.F.Ca.ET.205.01.1.1]